MKTILFASIGVAVCGVIVAVAAVTWALRVTDRGRPPIASVADKPEPSPKAAALDHASSSGSQPPTTEGHAPAPQPPPARESPPKTEPDPDGDEAGKSNDELGKRKAEAVKTSDEAVKSGDEAVKSSDDAVKPSEGKSNECTLRVTSSVKDAEVWVDGRKRGSVNAALTMRCRVANVTVRHPKYEVLTKTVTMTPDKVSTFAAKLSPAKVVLKVVSQPAGAVVTNEKGRVLGTTPFSLKLTREQETTLHFKAPGMAPDWRRVAPKSDSTVTITLQPAR